MTVIGLVPHFDGVVCYCRVIFGRSDNVIFSFNFKAGKILFFLTAFFLGQDLFIAFGLRLGRLSILRRFFQVNDLHGQLKQGAVCGVLEHAALHLIGTVTWDYLAIFEHDYACIAVEG